MSSFEDRGEWDAEFMGPVSENITDASYAARNVLEIAAERKAGLRR